MRTPSLRRRATLWTVGVLAVLLAVVGFGVDLALGTVLIEWVMGISDRQSWKSKMQPYGAAPLSLMVRAASQTSSQVLGGLSTSSPAFSKMSLL